jgi:hypothetical protein
LNPPLEVDPPLAPVPKTMAEMRERLLELARELSAIRHLVEAYEVRQRLESYCLEAAALASFAGAYTRQRGPAGGGRRNAQGLDTGNRKRWLEKNDEAAATRICSKCEIPKPFDAFRIRDSRKGTLTSWCIECLTTYHHERYVEARRNRLVVELVEGDDAIGTLCPVCCSKFKPGDRVVARAFAHEECRSIGGKS